MSYNGLYSPLNINCLGSLLQNVGLTINTQVGGTKFRIINNSGNGSIVTVTFTEQTAEPFKTGDTVYIKGAIPTDYNTSFTVISGTKNTVTFGSSLTSQITNVNDTDETQAYICTTGVIGVSTGPTNYYPGTLITKTLLKNLPKCINLCYEKLQASAITQNDYDKITKLGSDNLPALGLSDPFMYTEPYNSEPYTRHGFLRLLPEQAHNELYVNTGNYSEFFITLSRFYGYLTKTNDIIKSFSKATEYLDGIYSNMNDLITNDITGVNLSTFFWGTDLVASGRAIDLSTIDTFGNPENLLLTLQKNKAMTNSVSLALLANGLSNNDINGILNGAVPTSEQRRKIYSAFCLITGDDLDEVKVILNCSTNGIRTLADLLDPKRLFPFSYTSLTVPQYNPIKLPTNSKTYFLMYQDKEINMAMTNDVNGRSSMLFGSRLKNILPDDVAIAADAFATSMMQIKNIKDLKIEKFAQVVMHLENVSDLAVNGTNVPTDVNLAKVGTTSIAKGTGPDGTYLITDFFGCMSNTAYPYGNLQAVLEMISETGLGHELDGIYSAFYSHLSGPGPYDINYYATTINNKITAIYDSNPSVSNMLNSIYDTIGHRLSVEKSSRKLVIQNIGDVIGSMQDIYGFMDSLRTYALDTKEHGTAEFLERIADVSTLGGRSLIASMREFRNSSRMGLMGSELDNTIGIEDLRLPKVTGTKPNEGTTLPSNTYAGALRDITVITGAPTTPGSLAGSSETTLIPPNLDLFNSAGIASLTQPEQAVHEVVLCNCDCWDLLTHK